MRRIFFAFLCFWGVFVCLPSPGSAQVLTPDVTNQIFFKNFEVLYRADGSLDAAPFTGQPLAVGDHLVGIIDIQEIVVNGVSSWTKSNTDQLTGYFVQKVIAIDLPPDLLQPVVPGSSPHVTLGQATVDPFGKLNLAAGEMFRFWHDTGATPFEFNGTVPTNGKGTGPGQGAEITMANLQDDVDKATDGALWLSFGAGADFIPNPALGPNAQNDPDGFAYSHIPVNAPFGGFSGEAKLALNSIVNTTGFAFAGLNDPNELELGNAPTQVLTDLVGQSELEQNNAYAGLDATLNTGDETSPWYFASNDPVLINPISVECCVDIEKEIEVDGVWYDHDDCADAPVVTAPHDGRYRLIVTNCGNTVLTNAVIDDPTLGVVSVPIADLAPGETRTLTEGDIPELGLALICDQAGEFPNTASITADCAEGPVPSVSDEDSSCLVCTEEEIEQCRVTAGGNKDGLTIPCELKSNGMPDPTTCADKGPDTWGGQAGAPPRTDGNWTHHHKPDNKDTFVFHSNSLFDITCSDPGPICEPSNAPSPDRQIDFSGIGRFTNKHGVYAALPDGDLCFRVHLEDLGEPGPGGRRNDIDPTSCSHCPGTVIGNDPDCEHCTDYYMIRIYDSPDYDDAGDNCLGNIIYFNGAPSYDVCNQPGDPLLDGYYVRAGSVQMHTDNNGGSVGNEEICYDGIDNDGDGLIDAADPDCYSTETSCADGIDNDSDGLIDLADPDCQTCTPTAAKEHGNTCSDGFDNDCDGLIDAADPDC